METDFQAIVDKEVLVNPFKKAAERRNNDMIAYSKMDAELLALRSEVNLVDKNTGGE